MQMLNLGCGAKTSNKAGVINVDWSIYLRLKESKTLKFLVPLFIRGERLERFKALPDNILVCNLAKGIPFGSNSVDAIYHSHMLEHLDKDIAEKFLIEAHRVLKPGGVHRIVVPDFERVCRSYIAHIESCDKISVEIREHDSYVEQVLEQSVRKEAAGTSQQRFPRRFIENLVLGDARKRGETHQWMYDRINLKTKLVNAGYKEVHVQDFNTSLIQDWADYGLDADSSGRPYQPGSLYIEARK